MKTNIFLIAPFILLILAFSCQKKEEKNNLTVINGLVIDSLTNNPLKDVNVQLYKDKMLSEFPLPVSGYSTLTDTFGKFYLEFTNDESFVSYSLSVSKKGYQNYSPYFNSTIPIVVDKKQSLTIKMFKTK